MCPPAAAAWVADIAVDCSYEDLFKSLDNMICGVPLPRNVIADVNPFNYEPCNLPGGIWYLIQSKELANVEFGFWKAKAEAKLFSDPIITGWRRTLEFFEGQVPHEYKTDWLMYEYWITKTGVGENNQVKGASSLCRVFHSSDQVEQGMQEFAGSQNATNSHNDYTQADSQQAHNSSSSGPSGKAKVNLDGDISVLPVAVRPLNRQIEDPPEFDYVYRGDYLELLDLDNPASPSSSDNSSCLTMSSDECFDSLALLRELESESGRDVLSKDGNCKFNVNASAKPDEVVVLPASPAGTVVMVEESKPQLGAIDRTVPNYVDGDTEDQYDKVPKQSIARNRDEGPSTSPRDAGPSSRSPGGGKKEAKGRRGRLKRKYLCFMPFHMFF